VLSLQCLDIQGTQVPYMGVTMQTTREPKKKRGVRREKRARIWETRYVPASVCIGKCPPHGEQVGKPKRQVGKPKTIGGRINS